MLIAAWTYPAFEGPVELSPPLDRMHNDAIEEIYDWHDLHKQALSDWDFSLTEMSEWWERWWRRRWRIFEDFDRMVQDMFRDLSEMIPKEFVEERRLPDGSTVRTVGPFVWGYSFSIGPDGKPVIRGFGNVRPTKLGVPKPIEQREPLVDIIPGDKAIQVVIELPGVEKDDISLYTTENKLTVSVDTPKRKYYKEIGLPAKVDPKSAKASYKNGILEITLNRKEIPLKPAGEKVEIE